MATIHTENIAQDIRNDLKEKVTPMHIDAYNKIGSNCIYNLHDSESLAKAVLKGLDAMQIHNLVMQFEQIGQSEKVDFTCWFEFCRPLRAEMLTKERLAEIISEDADTIAYKTLENPVEFIEIYNQYVVPMVVQQKDLWK